MNVIIQTETPRNKCLTYLPLVDRVSIDSDNGLTPIQSQTIIWTTAGLLSIGPLGTNSSGILIKIWTFSFEKMRLNILSVKWRPFCPGGAELTHWSLDKLADILFSRKAQKARNTLMFFHYIPSRTQQLDSYSLPLIVWVLWTSMWPGKSEEKLPTGSHFKPLSCIISQYWDCAGIWNLSWSKIRTHSFCIVNTIAVNDLAMQGQTLQNLLVLGPWPMKK